MSRIVSIIEGHGEVEALPTLLRRLALHLGFPQIPDIERPFRIAKSKLLRPGELERAVELAARTVGSQGAILLILDADDDCPAKLGPNLLHRMQQQRSDRALGVVLACREFETWFLAAAPSLAGHRGLPADLTAPEHPEEIRGAKEWLTRQRIDGGSYSPAVDQASFAATMDLAMARTNSGSFDKLCRELERLCRPPLDQGSGVA